MSNIVNFKQHLQAVRLVGQSAAAAAQLEEAPAVTEEDVNVLQDRAYEKGKREARQEFKAKIDAAHALQNKLLKNLEAAEQGLNESVEAALPDLIIEGVRRVIPNWEPSAEDVQHSIREMVSGLEGESGPLEVRLNETDKTHLDTLQDGLWSDFNGTKLVIDKSLKPGECVISGRFGMVDGRFDSKLEHLRKDLG